MVLSSGPSRGQGTRTALWVVPVSDLGGVARHVRDAAGAGLPGWRLVVLLPPGPLARALKDSGCQVIEADIGPAHGLPRSLRALRTAVRQVRPALVHSHLSYADLVVLFAGVSREVETVSTEHGIAGDDSLYHRSGMQAALMTGLHTLRVRRLSALIAVSQATLATARERWRLPRSLRTAVILNGIERHEFQRGVGQPGRRFGALSRLSAEKGLPDLLLAFRIVHRSHPDATLLLAGTGPEEPTLRALVHEAGLADAVDFAGFLDPNDFHGRVDVMVQLSAWENCSYSVLDALGAGLGVVATDVGGNPELLPPHCLVGRGDVAGAAAEMLRQAHEPTRRPSLLQEWPTVSDMCAAIARVYEEVTA